MSPAFVASMHRNSHEWSVALPHGAGAGVPGSNKAEYAYAYAHAQGATTLGAALRIALTISEPGSDLRKNPAQPPCIASARWPGSS